MDRRGRDLGALALALLALIWGYNWVVMKIGLEYAQPFTFSALRTFLGALSLFALLLVLRRPLRPPPLGWTIVIGLLQTTGFVGPADVGARERRRRQDLGAHLHDAVLAAAAGVGVPRRAAARRAVARRRARPLPASSSSSSRGTCRAAFSSALAVAGGFCWAASAVVVKRLQASHEVDVLSLTTWQMLFGSLPLRAHRRAHLAGRSGVDDGSSSLALVYNVILANALAWFLWLFGLRRLSAGAAGIATLATPVIGVAAAWIQLGERPSAGEAAGMALIIGALAIVTARGLVAGQARRRRRGRT